MAFPLLVAGCGKSVETVDGFSLEKVLRPIKTLPWPAGDSPLPSCTPYPDGFRQPELAAASGDIELYPSALLQPLGAAAHIAIRVKDDLGNTDTAASGLLQASLWPSGEILSLSPLDNGRAELVLRFHRPGIHRVTVALEGGQFRHGQVELKAYETQLPIWELKLAEEDLARILAQFTERIYVPAQLTIEGVKYAAQARLHGGSSRHFPKKSFRIDLEDGRTLPNGSNHLILRAEWRDKSLLRNFLASEIFRQGTWLPVPEAKPVHFRMNGRYYGLMWHVERIDGDFLKRRGLNTSGSMYEGNSPSPYNPPGANFTPLASLEAYRQVYEHKKGPTDYQDLVELIEKTLQEPEETFAEKAWQALKVDDFLVFMAALAVLQDNDHVRKNYFLYRDPLSQDARWTIFPWDLDLSLGHLWSAQNGILDERIITQKSPYVGQQVPEHQFYSQLMTRLWQIPEFDERFRLMARRLVEKTFTLAFINKRIDNVLCRAAPEILADTRMRAGHDEFMGRVEELRHFVTARRAYIAENLGFILQ